MRGAGERRASRGGSDCRDNNADSEAPPQGLSALWSPYDTDAARPPYGTTLSAFVSLLPQNVDIPLDRRA